MKIAENLPKGRAASQTVSGNALFLFTGAVFFSLCLVVTGCGGGGGGGGSSTTPTPTPTPTPIATPTPVPTPTPTPTPAPVPDLNLTTSKESILRGETVSLNWTSSNASFVTASNFGANALTGSISVTPTATTNYTMTVNGPGGNQVASVLVNVAAVSVSISPSPAAVFINKNLSLTATVTGAVDTSVSWSVQEAGGGTIAPDPTDPTKAVYSAPAQAGVFHAVATSNADPSKNVTVEIRAQAANGNVTIQ